MRIGINIPNELMKRLEPLKPELNISQVCREALEAKAASHERMLARLDDGDIQEAVGIVWEQEKEFRAIIDVDWEMLGYEDAESWVKSASWADWEHLRHRQDVTKRQGRPAWDFPPPGLAGVSDFTLRIAEFHLGLLRQNDDFLDWLYEEHDGIDDDAAKRSYMTAWLTYSNAVWGLISQRREEHYRQLLAERKAPPQPEAPAHLLSNIPR